MEYLASVYLFMYLFLSYPYQLNKIQLTNKDTLDF